MYKVLLVDDEPAALEALRLAAGWGESGFYICGECGNGQEALKLTESLRPDLVIADVRMPVMDGLEFAGHVAEKLPGEVEIILVSGYDEFEYAKKAIKYGIRHYVLKPVIKEEFSEVLAEVTARFRQRDRIRSLNAWDKDIEAYNYFEKLISGINEENPAAAESPVSDARLQGAACKAFWVYAMIEPYLSRAFPSNTPNRTQISSNDLASELETPGCPFSIAHITPLGRRGYGAVLRCSMESSAAEAAEILAAKLTRIFSGSFYLSISSTADSLVHLGKLAKEAEEAMTFSFFRQAGSVLFYEDSRLCKLNYSLDRIAGRDDIVASLESLNTNRLDASIANVFNSFEKTMTAPEVVEIYLANIIFKGLELVKSMGGDVEEIVKNYRGGMLSFTGLSLLESKIIIRSYCRDILELLDKLKNTERQSDMLRVKDFIMKNYKSRITIKEISSQLYIHPVYLGYLIRKWFGCSFNEYVHKLRIEEAKRLLAETDLKVGDIAAEVGYGMYGVFLKQFEKYVLMKPAEYRTHVHSIYTF